MVYELKVGIIGTHKSTNFLKINYEVDQHSTKANQLHYNTICK